MKIHTILKKLFPNLTMTRPESLEAIKRLQEKLNDQKKERDYWRARCLKVEELYVVNIQKMKEVAQEYEGLNWRVL